MPGDTLGLYLSIPFCRAKCSFCNFASGVGNGSAMDRYVTQLCTEILTAHTLHTNLPNKVDSIYFGGGTPSLLSPAQLQKIFTAINSQFTIAPAAEITLEAAPNQIPDPLLDTALHLGCNRISLGVQSFIDRECTAVGRLHTGRDCVREVLRLRAAGLPEVAADLIAGLPYQTSTTFAESLHTATSIGLTHLSVYMLEVDEDSRLGREVLAGGQRFHAPGVPADELSAEMYEQACTWLPTHGFPQYEISNFALPHHQSRHNRKYWERAPYLGFGLDAHSMLLTETGAIRFANPDDLALYGNPQPSTPVTPREAFEETVFLGLRLNEGLQLNAWPESWSKAFTESAHDLAREGLLAHTNDRWSLTLRGQIISNEVFGALLETVPH